MSFYTSTKKPCLINPNVLKSIKEKLRQKSIKQKFLVKKMEEQQQLKMAEEEMKSQKWYNVIFKNIFEFIKDNYGFVILVILIIILLKMH